MRRQQFQWIALVGAMAALGSVLSIGGVVGVMYVTSMRRLRPAVEVVPES